MKYISTFCFTILTLLLLVIGPAPTQAQSPFLGTYPAGTVIQGGGTTITPESTPGNIVRVNASTSANFKGTLVVNPTTGIVRVSNAQPTGVYSVTVVGFNSLGGASQPRVFTLTVNKGPACNTRLVFRSADTINGGLDEPVRLTLGDIDNDGDLDIAIPNLDKNTVSIRLNDGEGRFTDAPDVSVNDEPVTVVLGDINNDGNLDLLSANYGIGASVSVKLGNGRGGFTGTTELSAWGRPVAVALADFNKDGKLDLFTTHSSNSFTDPVIRYTLFSGDGAGNFTRKEYVEEGGRAFGMAVGDFNTDGKPDFLVAAIDNGLLFGYRGDGTGNFTANPPLETGGRPFFVALGDVNNDGIPDVAVANLTDNSVSIKLGGFGTFFGNNVIPVGKQPYSVAIVDLNNDGNQDLLVTNKDDNTVSILLGNGFASFTPLTTLTVGQSPNGAAVGDLNNDGLVDIVSADGKADQLSVWLTQCNTSPSITAKTIPETPGATGVKTIATVEDTETGPGSVTVTVNGQASASVNGVTVSNITNANGTISANVAIACSASSASFTLTASDGVATTSVPFTVNLSPLAIIGQPIAATTVVRGTNVSVNVNTNGSGSLAYQWYKDGKLLSGQTAPSLTLPNAQLIDAGNYIAVITSVCASLTSTAVKLNVNSPIVISPASINVRKGAATEDVTLATITGLDAPPRSSTITVNGSTSATSNGVTLANLTIVNGTVIADITTTCASSPANFILNVTDGTLSTSEMIRVDFIPLPVPLVLSEPASLSTVEAGSDVSTSFTVRAGEPPSYLWYRNGTAQRQQTSSTLTLTNVQAGATGNYYAVATTGCTSLTSSIFSLSVISPAAITIRPSDPILLIVGEGKSAQDRTMATVSTTNGSPANLTVTINGSTTATSNGVSVTNLINNNGTIQADLAASCGASSANFTLTATDGTLSSSATVRIGVSTTLEPLMIVTQPVAASSVIPGTSVLVSVSVTSGERVSYQWFKENQPVNGQTKSTLSITNVQLSDAGNYVVEVANGSGCQRVTSTAFSLSVSATPLSALLTASSVTLVTTGATTLSASVTGGNQPYSYTFIGPGTITPAGNTAVASGLPAGLQTFTVSVTDATMPVAQTATATVSVTVGSPNTAPTTTGIASQTATTGQSFSLNIASAFTDAETPNGLTYSASGLPADLSISDGIISGTPSTTGVSTIVITATDPGSLTVSTQFILTLINAIPAITRLAANPAIVCTGNPVTFTATIGNFTGFYSYTLISGLSSLTGVSASPVFSGSLLVSGSGEQMPMLTIESGGQQTVAVTNLTVNARPSAPTLTSVSRTVNLSNTPLSLTQFVDAVGSNTLSFSGVNGLLNPPQTNISQAGTQSFSATQTDTNGCISLPTPFTITVQASLPASQTVCRNSRVVLSVEPTGTKYEWYRNGQSASSKLIDINSSQRGTATSSLTLVSVQTTATYYCKVFGPNGSFSWAGPFTVTVNFGCQARQSVSEEVLPLTLSLTPNPIEGGQLRALVRGAGGQALSVELLDLRGQVVGQQHWQKAEAEQTFEWNLNGWPVGTYLLKAQTQGQLTTLKVVKLD